MPEAVEPAGGGILLCTVDKWQIAQSLHIDKSMILTDQE
jgi:hypothetical protein